MKNRIKELRKQLGLNQTEFGARIDVKQTTIAGYENGRMPLDTVISSMCREFGVRRQWLEEGIGPMMQPADEDDEIVDAVLAGEDEFIKAVIRGIAKTPGGWEKMREVFTAIQAELDKQKEISNKNEQP